MTETLVQRRVRDLIAVVGEQHGAGKPFFVSLCCDGCGALAALPVSRPETWDYAIGGWTLASKRPYRDLCPECS